MIKTIGFLTGVGLTVAVFLQVLDKLERQESEIVAEATSELSPDIVAQADVEQTENKPDLRVPPDHEFVTADAGLQNSFMEATGDATQEQHAEASTAGVAQAIVVEAEQKSAIPVPQDTVFTTADAQQQNDFEISGMNQRSIDQAATDDTNRQDSSDTNTFQFWSPFRSAWAAQGFAKRLTSATQVPVEVFNTGPGKYRVAFSYQDETDRLARIERIETITGLKLE